MAQLVRHTHTAGSGPSPEQIARLNEAAKRPIRYTEDCPELTDEQLAEFMPVHFDTWEERTEVMRKASVGGEIQEHKLLAEETLPEYKNTGINFNHRPH